MQKLKWKAGPPSAGPDEPSASSEGTWTPLTVESSDNHVHFYSDVTADRCLALTRALHIADVNLRGEHANRDLPESHPLTPIHMHVHSPGGDVFAAFAAAGQIQRFESPVWSTVEGYAASAATILSVAASHRRIQADAFLLIHQVSLGFWGTASELEDESHLVGMLMDRLVRFYAKNSALKTPQIKKMLRRDTWLSAEECLAYGLVDEIL